MACPDDRKILLATDLDPNVFACDNGTITLKADPLPTASVYVAPGQPCDAVDVNLGYAKSDDCALPGGQTAGPWTLKNGLGAVIASGDDLEGVITLPNLCSEPLPFLFEYQVTDACGTSFPAESFGFSPAPAIPTATVLVDPNQWCGGVDITLGYAANPSCPTPGQTAGSWVIKDNLGATVASGTDLAGALPPQDLCAETGPFTLEATVTDACGTSATVIEPFATVSALPTAGIGAITPAQECNSFQFNLTHTPDPACPSGTQLTGAWSIKTSPGGVTLATGTDLASASPITAPDLCANTGEDLVIEYQTSDGCGTSPVATSPTFQVDPLPVAVPPIAVISVDPNQDPTSATVDGSGSSTDPTCAPITEYQWKVIGDNAQEFISNWTVGDAGPVGDAVGGTADMPIFNLGSLLQIIDDGDVGFIQTAGWTPFAVGSAYGGDGYFVAAGTGSEVATWTFTGLASGTYEVAITWLENVNRATDAPYRVLDGATQVANTTVDQQNPPAADHVESGVNFQTVFTSVSISSGTMVVELTNNANGFVIADAVRIESVITQPVSFELFVVDSCAQTGGADQGGGLGGSPTLPGTAGPLTIAANPTAEITAADNQPLDSVDISLDYTASINCGSPGQLTGTLEIRQGGVLVNTESLLEGFYTRDFTPWIKGNTGDIINAVYPADFEFELTYTNVTDACGTAPDDVINIVVEPILVAPYTYTGADQAADPPLGWANYARVQIWGAGGGSGGGTYTPGVGGYVEGVVSPAAYTLVVGEGGTLNTPAPNATYGGGGSGGFSPDDNTYGGSGGGLSGLFTAGVSFPPAQTDAIMVAGGGGAYGAHFFNEFGGPGGGNGSGIRGSYDWVTQIDDGSGAGGGGTQSQPGLGGGLGTGTGVAPDDYRDPSDPVSPVPNPGNTGQLFRGGDGASSPAPPFGQNAGAGGGGGLFGGGGGSADWGANLATPGSESVGGGGGGSGYIDPIVAAPTVSGIGTLGSNVVPNATEPNYSLPTIGYPAGSVNWTGPNNWYGAPGLIVITYTRL